MRLPIHTSTDVPSSFGRILIVDDETKNLQLVGEILRRVGMPFIFAINGEEALTVSREQQPALILLDIMMPGVDGLTVCKQLKEDPQTAHIPVIFLTAATELTDVVSGFAAGGVDYIKKPFIKEELLARVRTHLQLHYTQQELSALYQRQTELLATLAHDIKNPASGIQGIATMLKDDIQSSESDSPEELCSMLDVLIECAIGMNELVNGILNEERDKHENADTVASEQISVSEVLSHLVKLNRVHAHERDIELAFTTNIEPAVPISRRILNEIFDNIISNAVKYSRSDSTVSVRLRRAQKIGQGFRVEVEDSANPIAEEVKAQLFKNSFRLIKGR